MQRYLPTGKFLLLICSVIILSSGQAFGIIDVPISSTLNPVGSGARALGMGGAFIGVADDATAASWNPAGLIQLESPEISFVSAWNNRRENATFPAFPEASGMQEIDLSDLNYLSAAYPFQAFNTNMVASLNYQHLFDFHRQQNYFFQISDTTFPPLLIDITAEDIQKGSLKALSPAVSFQATPFISFGISLNFWDPGVFTNQWTVEQSYSGEGGFDLSSVGGGILPLTIDASFIRKNTLDGMSLDLTDPFHWQNVNFNIGMLWDVNSLITVGAVFKSPFEVSIDNYWENSEAVSTGGVTNISHTYGVGRDELTLPMAYGLGMALRFSDEFSVDLDIYRTHWEDYIFRDTTGMEVNPVTGLSVETSGKNETTTQVRLGGEYLFVGNDFIIPLRAGLFSDPEPAMDGSDDFFGFSLGSGIAAGNVVCDIAYQFRYGNDVRKTIIGGSASTQDVKQHTIYFSYIFYF